MENKQNWLNKIDKPFNVKTKSPKSDQLLNKIDPEQHAKVSALIHKTALEMK